MGKAYNLLQVTASCAAAKKPDFRAFAGEKTGAMPAGMCEVKKARDCGDLFNSIKYLNVFLSEVIFYRTYNLLFLCDFLLTGGLWRGITQRS